MDNEFKILYSDTTGNLDLGRDIGPCDIYITNNINRFSKIFTVISKNGRYCFHYNIYSLEIKSTSIPGFSDNNYFNNKSIHNKVYKYITTQKDDNGIIKWNNMIDACKILPENIITPVKFKDWIDTWVYIFIENTLLDVEKYELEIRYDYIYFPILHIHPIYSLRYECMIRLDTLEYFGGCKLNERQSRDLIKYLCSRNNPDSPDNNAYSAFVQWTDIYKSVFGKEYHNNGNDLLNINMTTKINWH